MAILARSGCRPGAATGSLSPPPDVVERIEAYSAIEVSPASWETMIVADRHKCSTVIVKLSNRIEVDWIEAKSIDAAKSGRLVASWPGTLAAALVMPPLEKSVIAVSMYAPWVNTHVQAERKICFPDGSAHRIVSDLSTFVAAKHGHLMPAAGDLNILTRLRGRRRRILGRPLRDRARPDGNHWIAVRRTRISQQQAGQTMAGQISTR